MTPIEYCRAVRIARARELLEGGDTSQKQIAQSLGYKDVASFARVFRKAIGSAPGAYRKRFGRKGISPADFAAKDGSDIDLDLLAVGIGLTREGRPKRRGTVAFRRCGLVSVCGVWQRKHHSGHLSLKGTFWCLVFDGAK